jgi:hypothetical protein
MCRILLSSLLVTCLSCALTHSAVRAQVEYEFTTPSDSSAVAAEEYPWEGHVFLAAGYGVLQGFRAELGWNMGRYFFSGTTFGIGDYWSRDPGEGTIGVFGGIHIPVPGLPSFTPYILVGSGGTVSVMSSNNDTYTFVNAGAMIPLIESVTLRPELSVCFTSKVVYGLPWGMHNTLPEKKRTYPGANLVLELDL